jgi:hypothetical protein
MHETEDRIRFGRIIGNASRFEDWRGRLTTSDPHGKYRLRPDKMAAMRLRGGGDRFCCILGRSERGRNIHDKNGVVLGVFEQTLQRSGVTGSIGIAGDVDGIGT